MNRNGSVLRAAIVAVVFGATVLAPGTARAAACFGPPITTDTTLGADIVNCADNGVEIGANGVTLNLGGFTIDGDDDADDFGVFNPGFDDVTIVGPGTITEFGGGVRIEDAIGNSVRDLNVEDNMGHGIAVTPSDINGAGANFVTTGTVIDNNDVDSNDLTGIIVYRSSKRTTITDNDVTSNVGDGIFLGGAGERLDLDDNSISSADDKPATVSKANISLNGVDSNAGSGIVIDATGVLDDDNDDDLPGGSENVIDDNESTNNGTNISPENIDTNCSPDEAGHEEREGGCGDRGGHGIKVVGTPSATKITNNLASGNGNPGTADECFERNGAGIFVAGKQKGITISGNTTDDNAMAGIFGGGELDKVAVKENPSVDGNVLNCSDDEAGIHLTGQMAGISIADNPAVNNNAGSGIKYQGHNKSLKITNNVANSNIGDLGAGVGNDDVDTAGILVHGRSIKLRIIGNTASTNSNAGSDTGHGIDVRGSLGGLRDEVFIELLVKNNTTNNNEGWGVGTFVQASQPCKDAACKKLLTKEPPSDEVENNSSGLDKNANKTRNVTITGNTSNDNGLDGFFAITDVTFTNNTANDNGDFGIEFNSDPTAQPRDADAEDGPHKLKDGGSNSATGNGTDCSAGLSC